MINENHRPVLIVIAGPNGSGKTTITSRILHHEWMENAIYINPDIIAQEKFGDWNSHEAIMKAVDYSERLREECLEKKQSIIFETVLSVESKIDYIKRAKDAGFFIRLFFVSTSSPTINASRIATSFGGWTRCSHYQNYITIQSLNYKLCYCIKNCR